MSTIEFDAETVRRKPEEYDKEPAADWPVWITDGAGASLLVSFSGDILMGTPGYHSGYFFGQAGNGAREYLTEVLNAVAANAPTPPLASVKLLELGAVKYGREAYATLQRRK